MLCKFGSKQTDFKCANAKREREREKGSGDISNYDIYEISSIGKTNVFYHTHTHILVSINQQKKNTKNNNKIIQKNTK